MSLGESRWAAALAQVAESPSAEASRLAESRPGSAWVVGWAAVAESRSVEGLERIGEKGSAVVWPLAVASAEAAFESRSALVAV